MFIRPALDPSGSDGARLRVRDPETMEFLADGGEEKPASEYWLRRQRDGDVEEKVKGRWPKAALADPSEAPAVPTTPEGDAR